MAFTLTAGDFNEDALADQVVFIDNDGDGKIEAVQIKTQDATQVTYVGSDNIATKALLADDRDVANEYAPFDNYETNPKLADVTTYEGIAKDDYVKVSYDYYTDKVVYEKIDAVEATVEATRTADNGATQEIRIDGTWYSPAEGYEDDMPSIISGDTVEYVAIGTLLYNVKKTDGMWGSKSLAVVYDVAKYNVGARENRLEVSIITRDGSKIVGLLDEYNNADVTYAANQWTVGGTARDLDNTKTFLTGKLMTYRQTGDEIDLMPVSLNQKAGYDTVYQNVNQYVDGEVTRTGAGNVKVADDAVVFVVDTDDAKILTGKGAKSAFGANAQNADAVATGGEVNGANYVQALAITVADIDDVEVTGANYAYVMSAAETRKDDFAREFRLWTVNGELLAYEKTDSFYEYEGGEIITYDITSTEDGTTVIDNIKLENVQLGRVNSNGLVDSDSISIDTTPFNADNSGTPMDLDSDCEIINVNTDKDEGIEGDAASAIRYGMPGTANIAYIQIGSDIVFILVDGANEELSLPYAEMPATATAAEIEAAFDYVNMVTIDDDYTLAANLDVPADKTLTVTGTLALNGNTLDVDGDVVADSMTGNIAANLTGDGNVQVGALNAMTVADYKDLVAANAEQTANNEAVATLVDDLLGGFTQIGESSVYTHDTGADMDSSLVDVTNTLDTDAQTLVDIEFAVVAEAPEGTGSYATTFAALADATDTNVKIEGNKLQLHNATVTGNTFYTAVQVTITATDVVGSNLDAASQTVILCVKGA